MNINELTVLCRKWQERLGLAHWQIALRICRSDEMDLKDVFAENKISLDTECAIIRILDSADYPETPFEKDMEVSLVHELLHIPMLYISNPEDGTLEYVHTEAFIERMARLLVWLSRGGKV